MNEIQNVIKEFVQLRASFLETESQHDIYFRLYREYQKKVIELQRAIVSELLCVWTRFFIFGKIRGQLYKTLNHFFNHYFVVK